MRVRATREGYLGCFRKPGDVFDVPDGTKGSWLEPVKDGEASASPSTAEVYQLRAQYEKATGKAPGKKWGADAIRKKLQEFTNAIADKMQGRP